MSVTSLAARGNETWQRQVDAQDRERIESPDVFMALAQLPDLTEIRPGVITEIDTPGWPDDDLYRLADCLLVPVPDQDPEAELWDEDTYNEHCNMLEALGVDESTPVLDRILYVNGTRWVVAVLGDEPAVVPPSMRRQWAEFHFSVTDVWEFNIGLATPTVVVEQSSELTESIAWLRLTEPVDALREWASEVTGAIAGFNFDVSRFCLQALASPDGRATSSVAEAMGENDDDVGWPLDEENLSITFSVDAATRTAWLARWEVAEA